MNHEDFEYKSKQQWVEWQKKSLRKAFLIGLLYPALLIWQTTTVYHNPSSCWHGLSLGIIICSFLFYLIQYLSARDDYKRDREILQMYDKFKIEWSNTEKEDEKRMLNIRVSNLERRANELVDENKILKSKLQEAEMSSCKCPEASLHPQDESNKPQWLGRKETPDQTKSA